MILAGIDEAGFGPVLGPLLVSATAFSLPAEMAGQSMWQLLSSAVARKPSKKSSRLAIADSKKLYSSQKENPLANLERGVLAMLAARDIRVPDLGRLLAAVSPGALRTIENYPWYNAKSLPLPRAIGPATAELDANNLLSAMKQAGVEGPVAMRSEVVFEGDYNRLVQATDNKSTVLFDTVCRLLMYLWEITAGQDMKIVVDRQGGRWYYLDRLQRIWPDGKFKVLDESENVSAYRIFDGRRTVEIVFLVEAEDQHLPVALASMMCKYLRELFMGLLNEYWAKVLPGLAPTAGYHVDGNRFWKEIVPHVQQMGINEAWLYRSR